MPDGAACQDAGDRWGRLLLLVGHGFEPGSVDRVGEQIGELVEVLVCGKGPGGFEEAESGGVRRKDVAERANLPRIEALDFKCLAR